MPKSNHSMKLPTTVPEIAVRSLDFRTTSTSSTSSLLRRAFVFFWSAIVTPHRFASDDRLASKLYAGPRARRRTGGVARDHPSQEGDATGIRESAQPRVVIQRSEGRPRHHGAGSRPLGR